VTRSAASPPEVGQRHVGMRWAGVGFVILALAGCASGPATPATVQPTVAAIESLGYRGGDGIEDNVPSGLSQWSCDGTIAGVPSTILVDGNADGVAGVTLLVEDPRNPGATANQFARLVDAVPPLNRAPVLKDSVAGWAGGEQAWTVGAIRISAQCDATRCLVGVVPAGDALRPLPIP
jgi:hypothetical protein